MSTGRGGSSNTSNGGGLGSIPAASKKMIQELKEIVKDCPEAEIYAMLKECNMDPNETVNRILAQDPFHEVKSKREKKKENKDGNDSRSRGNSSTSSRGGRGGGDRYSGRGSTAQFGSSEAGASRGKSGFKRDNGPNAYASAATGMAGNNVNRRQPPVSDATTDKAFTISAESFSAALPSSGHQSESYSATLPSSGYHQPAWSAMAGQVSMADIVKMGRPHGKTSSRSLNTAQQHVSYQHAMSSQAAPAPHDLRSSPNYATKVSEMNPESGVAGSQHVPPDDEDDGWHLDEEAPTASVSSIVEPTVESEPYGDAYDRTEQQFRSPSDEVRFAEDGTADYVGSAPVPDQNLQDDHPGSASGFESDLYQNINAYQVHHREAEDANASVSSVTTNFQNLSLPKEDEDSRSEEDGPAVKIPDHLQVQSADCSHLSFGSFGSGMNAPFSGSFTSRTVKSIEEEPAVTADASPVEHSEARNSEYYDDEHLRTTSDRDAAAHRMGVSSGNFDSPSVSQSDMLKQEAPEAAQGNQYSFPSSTANYNFENSQQLNASSYAQSQTSSQMQGLPSLAGVMPYSNSLPSALLASNVQQQPLREELAYSPFPISQSTPTKYNNSVSSISGPTASMAEALKTGNFSAAQSTQTPPGGNVSGNPGLPQHLPVHPYSQPSLQMGPGPFPNMISYPLLPHNYAYMPSAFQQAFAAGNSTYHQSLAAMLPQYKNSVSVSSLPQSAAVAPGYGGAFGNSNSIPNNFPLNPPAAPTGTSMSYDDVLSSQYKEASHLLSLQQGPGSRTISGVPGSTYYSFQGQTQQPAGFRQSQQQPSQHYGALSGYPNFYHSQAGLSLEHQQQMSRDGSLGGSQGQQPKQSPQQIWQNGY